MTFSIIARCPRTGQFGAAVASSSPAVAARCIRARAGVGAAASQNITDPALGPQALDLMAAGQGPAEALGVLRAQPFIDYRQLMAIDAQHAPAGRSFEVHGLGGRRSAHGVDLDAGDLAGRFLRHDQPGRRHPVV